MDKELWTIGRLLQWTGQYFSSKGIESSRLDGEVLLSHVLGVDRMYLYMNYDRPMTQAELDQFRPLVKGRVEGYSVAALVGKKEFMGLTFTVNEHVLIPRPDTETLVEDILSLLDQQGAYRILDVCTGPGTILYSLLHYMKQATGLGLDISEEALKVAEINRANLSLMDRAEVKASDLVSGLSAGDYDSFDVIVSNPPYIPSSEVDTLATEVLHEPRIALDGGADGLDLYRRILVDVVPYLKVGGYLALEIGQGQEEDLKALAKDVGCYSEAVENKDLAGIIREVRFQKIKD